MKCGDPNPREAVILSEAKDLNRSKMSNDRYVEILRASSSDALRMTRT